MSLSKLILAILFFIITGIFQSQALTNYCATPFTASSDGTTILYLTCQHVSGTTYLFELDFNSAVSLTGDNLNIGFNVTPGPTFTVTNSNSTLSNGNKTLSCTFTSTTTPSCYVDYVYISVGGSFKEWHNVLPTGTINFAAVCSSPLIASAGSPQSVCSNAPFTLGGSPTAANGTSPYTYLWSSNPPGFTSTAANPTASLTTTTTYTVTVTDAAAASTTANVVITKSTVTAAPTVSSNSPILQGLTLTLSCSSASTYTWTGPNSFSSAMEYPTISNAQTVNAGTYTVSISDAYGCTNTGSVVVTVLTPQIYYVNDNSTSGDTWCKAVGSDANDGKTPCTPKLTLAALLSAYTLNPNDIVRIDNGTYSWGTITFASGGSSSGYITITGAGAAKTLITSSGSVFNCNSGANYIIFQNMSCTSAVNNYGFNLSQCSYTQIKNCTINSSSSGATIGAIYLFNSVNNCIISGNTINFAGTTAGCAAIMTNQPDAGSNITITQNKINGVNGSEPSYGIYVSSYFPSCTITNNYLSNFVYGIYFWSAGGTTIVNNNSFYCKTTCFWSANQCCGTFTIKNNIFYSYGLSSYCMDFGTIPSPSPTCNYNLYYCPGGNCVRNAGNVYLTYAAWKAAYPSDGSSQSGDPLYNSPTSGDLSVLNSVASPAKSNGVTGLVTVDINGTSRGNPPCIGAYEIGLIASATTSASGVCSGSSVTLSVNASGGATPYTYVWSSNPAGLNSTSVNPAVTVTANTIYTVTVTDNNSYTATSSVAVTVNTLTASAASSLSSAISGSSVTLSANASGGTSPYSYSWVSSPAGLNSTSANPTVTITATSTYTVTVTDNGGCGCTATSSVAVLVYSKLYVNGNSTVGDVWCTAVGLDAAGRGGKNNPYATVGYLINNNVLTGGDTVFIDKGTYNLGGAAQFFRTAVSGTASNQITFLGADTSLTIFTANTNTHIFYVQESASFLTFKNIQFYQPSTANGQAVFTVEGGTNQNIQIISCEFNNQAHDDNCITTAGLNTLISKCSFNNRSLCVIRQVLNHNPLVAPSVTIDGCIINIKNDQQPASCSAIELNYSNANNIPNTISDNKIIGDATADLGIFIDGGITNLTMKNNYISGFNAGIWISNGTNNYLYFNSIYARTYGIDATAANSLSGWNILNNIFDIANAGGYAIWYGSATSFPTIQNYDLFYAPGSTLFKYGGATYTTTSALYGAKGFENNALTTNPIFANPSTGNLDLFTGSPAAGAGLTIAGITTDIYYKPRPNPGPAIGACELNSVLPIELISFEARCQENMLTFLWSTATETNNNYFTLESSQDGVDFEPVTNVQGAGNSNVVNNYSFIDDLSYTGILYYRLKQTDYNGHYSYSNTIIAQNNCNEAEKSSPNIISAYYDQGSINIIFSSDIDENFVLRLISADGRLLYSKIGFTNENITNVSIPCRQLAPAIYIITLQLNNSFFSKKIFLNVNN